MQNFPLYINKAKIINIKSEILCREAEDEFFYFNKIDSAYRKLNEAVKLTPFHQKSLLLLADICFIKGFIKKSLYLYKQAEKILPLNIKILASIANCNYVLKNFEEALLYCNKAIKQINIENNNLYSQIIEIKISILTEQNKYEQAYIAFINAKNILDKTFLKMIYNNYGIINTRINLHKKLQQSNLKIV